jgi:hypothetical protein
MESRLEIGLTLNTLVDGARLLAPACGPAALAADANEVGPASDRTFTETSCNR